VVRSHSGPYERLVYLLDYICMVVITVLVRLYYVHIYVKFSGACRVPSDDVDLFDVFEMVCTAVDHECVSRRIARHYLVDHRRQMRRPDTCPETVECDLAYRRSQMPVSVSEQTIA